MSSTPFHEWKVRASKAREAWALQCEAELNTYLDQLLSGEEISDEAFIATVMIYYKMCDVRTQNFSTMTVIRADSITDWLYNRLELPPTEIRQIVITLCKKGVEKIPLLKRMENLLRSSNDLPDSFFSFGDESTAGADSSVLVTKVPTEEVGLGFDPLIRICGQGADYSFSVRTDNCLNNANLLLLGQIVSCTESELLRIDNFGRKSLNELKEVLIHRYRVRLGMAHPILDEFLIEHPLPADIVEHRKRYSS